jgi:membrane protein
MDWLTRLPWIGPRIAAAMRTHAWRAYAHLRDVHWTRLAAAMTFTSFLALFPLLAVSAAIGAALLSQHQLDTMQRKISEQIPGISDQLDINGLVANAGTVGGIAGAALVLTGIGWVGSLRECLRAVWRKDDEERNLFVGKLMDSGVLLGLGVAVLISLGASAFATAAVNWTADRAGIGDKGPEPLLLTLVGYCIAVLADFLILTYLLTLLPGVEPPRRSVVLAAFIGAVGFEVLKVLISGYLQQVAGRSMYGAFGTPIALLLWFNLMAKLLLYCAAWTATPRHAPEQDPGTDPSPDPGTDPPDPAPARALAAPARRNGRPHRDGGAHRWGHDHRADRSRTEAGGDAGRP